MKLAQVVRDRFNEITQWRSLGESWQEIDGRFRAMGQNPGGNSVRTLYRQELARRRSPERESALKWANGNYHAIKDLLAQGYDWTAILILIPPDFDVGPGSAGLTRLVAEFMSIDRHRSRSCQVPATVTTLEIQSGSDTDPAIQARPSTVPSASPLAILPLGSVINDESASHHPDSDDEKRALNHKTSAVHLVMAEVKPELVSPEKRTDSGIKMKPQVTITRVDRATAQVKAPEPTSDRHRLTPQHNPFESGPELHQRLMDSARKRNELHQKSLSLPKQQREAAKKLVSEASKEYDQLRVDFLYRFGDHRAKYSKLHLLSAKALECGAVEVVDAQTENAIMLQGYDRPDSIEGLEEVPEPLFIRENLTDGELGKIEEAYANDGLELEGRNAVVRLAEAVCMRGEYLFRLGWHEYDTLVRLEGKDFPSPTLCNANKWQIRSRAIELWPKLTGNEPVQPSEFERKRLTYRPDPELEKRGEWT